MLAVNFDVSFVSDNAARVSLARIDPQLLVSIEKDKQSNVSTQLLL